MSLIPPSLQSLIEALGVLPGVGPRSAERYAYYLLGHNPQLSERLSRALKELHGGIAYCQKTFALVPAGQRYSELYTDPKRDKAIVAVVAEPLDIIALEKTASFHGTYHVLGGLVSPLDGVGPEDLHLKELVDRVRQDKVKEVILALNASVEAETTSLLIQSELAQFKLSISRLARGLPVGLELEYADQLTLSRALEGRQSL